MRNTSIEMCITLQCDGLEAYSGVQKVVAEAKGFQWASSERLDFIRSKSYYAAWCRNLRDMLNAEISIICDVAT
jgi:hypothetical protein